MFGVRAIGGNEMSTEVDRNAALFCSDENKQKQNRNKRTNQHGSLSWRILQNSALKTQQPCRVKWLKWLITNVESRQLAELHLSTARRSSGRGCKGRGQTRTRQSIAAGEARWRSSTAVQATAAEITATTHTASTVWTLSKDHTQTHTQTRTLDTTA